MAFGTVYATGTISVAVGSTIVTGTGVSWTGFEAGLDTLYAGGASALTLSANPGINQITLAHPWAGPALVNQPYALLANSPLRYDPTLTAMQVQDLLDRIESATTIDLISVHGADVPAASTINLEAATGNLIDITGATTINLVTLGEGHHRTVRFASSPAPLVVASGTMILPAPGNIQAQQGDIADLYGYAGGIVRWQWTRKSGLPLVGRETLTANRTYYYRTDGNDGNTGLANSASAAFLTPQKGIDVASALDGSIYNVDVRAGITGTYPGVNLKPYLGSGSFSFVGDPGVPSNVVLSSSTGDAIRADGIPGRWSLSGFKLTSTFAGGGNCLAVLNGSRVSLDGPMDFGAALTGYQVRLDYAGQVQANASYGISGSANAHIVASANSAISYFPVTVTLTGTPAFSQLAFVYFAGNAYFSGASITFVGSATGQRYNVSAGGVINTGGRGVNYFPGSTPGIASGGQYI